MNIYCVIFMCTFGANTTDTEISSHNTLIGNSSATGIRNGLGNAKNGTDVASLILPERGAPVPQFGDIVMELPENSTGRLAVANSQRQQQSTQEDSNIRSSRPTTDQRAGPTLAEILLPPAPLKNSNRS